jgi:hypothetical protein
MTSVIKRLVADDNANDQPLAECRISQRLEDKLRRLSDCRKA